MGQKKKKTMGHCVALSVASGAFRVHSTGNCKTKLYWQMLKLDAKGTWTIVAWPQHLLTTPPDDDDDDDGLERAPTGTKEGELQSPHLITGHH